MHYGVFYSFEHPKAAVSSAKPIPMTAAAVCEHLLGRLRTEHDYLGLIDAADRVLQISVAPGGGQLWVELLEGEARASYGRAMDQDAVKALLLKLPRVLDRREIPGMEYTPW